jgi:hypothetical protein
MNDQFAIASLINSIRNGSPLLWRASVLLGIGALVCLAAQFFDARLFQGVNTWDKPTKFFVSLAVQLTTVAFALSFLKSPTRGVTTASWLLVGAAWFEAIYIVYRGANGEASHFNNSTAFASIMYGLMGVGSLMLTGTSAFMGWRVWQRRDGNLMQEAAGFGLMLGAFLGTISASILSSSQTGHFINGDLTDATGLPIFHWSTTGGDWRVGHFIGLHAAQFLPLAALSENRRIVFAAAIFVSLLTVFAMAQAFMGVPFLRV